MGKALHPSPEGTQTRSYFTIQLMRVIPWRYPRGLEGKKKKKAENEKHLWEDTQSKKLQEPNEPSLPLSGVVQLQTQKTLPKWVADADTKSTLTKEQQMTIRKTLHTRLTQLEEKNNDSKGITCVFEVGGG